MGIGTAFGIHLMRLLVEPGRHRFEHNLNNLEGVQRERLSRWLAAVARAPEGQRRGIRADWSWETFSRELPVSTYADHAELIARQRRLTHPLLIDSPVMRHQPTSGTTAAVKWVPYTELFLEELDAFISAWVGDLYRQFPRQDRGSHYWALSWMPAEIRAQTTGDLNDDMQLLPWGKRLLAYLTQAAPQEIALADTSEDALFATIAWLASDASLGFISLWSPTFGLSLLSRMADWRDELAAALSQGDWGARTPHMAGLPCPTSARAARLLEGWSGHMDPLFFQQLWPNLSVVSAWDTAASAPWARQLHALLPHAGFQGKGLWATEGVVTMPFQGHYPLAYLSHVYEFIDTHDGRVLPPWALREGQDVIPLLTTGSGLARYELSDVLRVQAPLGQVPCFTFLGRRDEMDLVGEKISALAAQAVLDGLQVRGAMPVTLLALDEAKGRAPGYVLLVECPPDAPRGALQRDLGAQVENALQRHPHYQTARDRGQLQAAACVALPGMRELYLTQCCTQGMIEGDIKVEPLRRWAGAAPAALRQALDLA